MYDDERFFSDDARSAPLHDHAVDLYADDFALSQELIRFVEDGLILGERVVVVVNERHRASIVAWKAAHPLIGDPEDLQVADAAETLQMFMVAGVPDPQLFEAAIAPIFEQAAGRGQSVRFFGEMVALLWADGNVTGALALESLWNDVARNRRFFLLCAYPEALLVDGPLRAVNAMCDHHSDLSVLGHMTQFAAATPATRSHTQRLLLPVPTAVSVARQIAIRALVDWELSHLIHQCAPIAMKLVADTVQRAGSSIRLTLSRDATCLRIAVEDADPCLRAADRPRNDAAMVEAVASGWGCDVTPDGKTVWAELSI
jgi:hypothetical protein